MVKAHILLRKFLQLEKIHLLVGGSMGGYQVLEWAAMENSLINRMLLLATSAKESAWGIAIHTTQRLAIEADATWLEPTPDAGYKGLKTARAIGMLTYRNYTTIVEKQTDPDDEKLDNYQASSYIHYQGEKLVKRFNAYSYWILTKALDSHHLGRGRGGKAEDILKTMKQQTLVIGIGSDILCPVQEQKLLAGHMQNATFIEIDSNYGHDGFMVESEKISAHLSSWLSDNEAAF
jgi:homoserine O-acetyltransferase